MFVFLILLHQVYILLVIVIWVSGLSEFENVLVWYILTIQVNHHPIVVFDPRVRKNRYMTSILRVVFQLKTGCGYPKDEGFFSFSFPVFFGWRRPNLIIRLSGWLKSIDCNNVPGGGGGNYPKIRHFVWKWIGTQKWSRLFRRKTWKDKSSSRTRGL
jgi:hypothetical protein